MREKTYHLYLNEEERSRVIQSLIELKNNLAAQELGHAQLSINSESYSRRDMGFQAVCIGYMICKKYGVDTQNFAINRIPEGLASKEPKEIRAELSKTRNAMAEIHSHISDEMFRKKQERSKDYER
nr:hypothetical protein [Dorea longicatena]